MCSAAVTRRSLLAGSAAAALAAVVPGLSKVAAAAPLQSGAVFVDTPMWAVGTPDLWNWAPIVAPDAESARREWMAERTGLLRCEMVEYGLREAEGPDCTCEWCADFRSAVADRQPAWDGKQVVAGDADWLAAWLGAECSRCGEETHQHDGAVAIAGKTVCAGCLTPEDIDPARAAELREVADA